MGKSSKKSATKVDSAVVAAVPTKALPKGKREAEVVSKKDVSKKQKVEEKKVLKKVESSSEEDSDEAEELPKTKLPVKNGKVESDSEDDSGVEEESSSDEEAAPAKKAPAVKAKAPVKKSDSSDESEEESSDEEEAPAKPTAAATKKKAESSEEESEEESDDDKKADEESSDDEEASDEEETPAKTQKKDGTDVKMTDAEKTPKTPSAPKEQGTGSKTLFVGNMSFSCEEADVRNFFQAAGEVKDVRFAMKDDSFRGFGHVEFATSEAAQKALDELNGQDLCGRAVRLDLAREKGAYTPGGNDTQSYQKGGKSNGGGTTAFVKGFDKYKGEDEIRSALEEHFSSCGAMTRCSIPTDRETGDVKGMAYIDFADSDAFTKALELDGSEFGGRSLVVNEATPRADNSGGGGFSGGRGGGGRFGNSSGRGRGGRDGRGRGGRDGRGRGGRDGRGRGRDSSFKGNRTTFD